MEIKGEDNFFPALYAYRENNASSDEDLCFDTNKFFSSLGLTQLPVIDDAVLKEALLADIHNNNVDSLTKKYDHIPGLRIPAVIGNGIVKEALLAVDIYNHHLRKAGEEKLVLRRVEKAMMQVVSGFKYHLNCIADELIEVDGPKKVTFQAVVWDRPWYIINIMKFKFRTSENDQGNGEVWCYEDKCHCGLMDKTLVSVNHDSLDEIYKLGTSDFRAAWKIRDPLQFNDLFPPMILGGT